MKRTFYVFWGNNKKWPMEFPRYLGMFEKDIFFNLESCCELLKNESPYPETVVATEIELDDFIPAIKLGLIHPEHVENTGENDG